MEHSRILGDSREKIAAEKVAVAEPGSVLIASRQTPGVEEVIQKAVSGNSLRRVLPIMVDISPLPGLHQLKNSSLAVTAAMELFEKTPEEVASAYKRLCGRLKWPGRLDFRAGDPPILFDVAHNPSQWKPWSPT